jgi:hypothetical protein
MPYLSEPCRQRRRIGNSITSIGIGKEGLSVKGQERSLETV